MHTDASWWNRGMQQFSFSSHQRRTKRALSQLGFPARHGTGHGRGAAVTLPTHRWSILHTGDKIYREFSCSICLQELKIILVLQKALGLYPTTAARPRTAQVFIRTLVLMHYCCSWSHSSVTGICVCVVFVWGNYSMYSASVKQRACVACVTCVEYLWHVWSVCTLHRHPAQSTACVVRVVCVEYGRWV